MTKGERISRFVEELEGTAPDEGNGEIADHPCYRGFFRCWNEQRYYEAHDVLEHLWLEGRDGRRPVQSDRGRHGGRPSTGWDDSDYFKGLIQAAGAFVHLQKQFEHPTHAKHGRRLGPAVRLFALAQTNLAPFAPVRHRFDVARLLVLLGETADAIVASEFTRNPWSPKTAPRLDLL